MTESINMIREFCDRLLAPEKARTTRIVCYLNNDQIQHLIKIFFERAFVKWFQFFPEANEVKFAQKTVFGGTYFKLDYLTKPSLFEDFGFFERVKMADRVKPEDQLFLVAYPYFNVNGNFMKTLINNIHILTHSFVVLLLPTQRCLQWKSSTKKLL